jgi:hypothetical protein
MEMTPEGYFGTRKWSGEQMACHSRGKAQGMKQNIEETLALENERQRTKQFFGLCSNVWQLSIFVQTRFPVISSILSTNPLPINLNLHAPQIHIPRTAARLLHPRRQPILRLPVIKRPLRHDQQERERRAAEADIEGFVDVLGGEADDDGEDAGCDEEEGGEEVGEGLAGEVLFCSV